MEAALDGRGPDGPGSVTGPAPHSLGSFPPLVLSSLLASCGPFPARDRDGRRAREDAGSSCVGEVLLEEEVDLDSPVTLDFPPRPGVENGAKTQHLDFPFFPQRMRDFCVFLIWKNEAHTFCGC